MITRNFLGTYKRPASFEELRACKQCADEMLREYIHCWNLLRNSAERISEDNAIYAFTRGICRLELKKALGRAKPKTIAHLLQIANEWADSDPDKIGHRSVTIWNQLVVSFLGGSKPANIMTIVIRKVTVP